MATWMTDEQLQALLATAERLEEFRRRSEEDDEDFVTAALYRTAGGRHFRVIEASGDRSDFGGAGGIGEWLEASEVTAWRNF